MSLKNSLVNSINTKVSGGGFGYTELLRTGAERLDQAFKPHKNTNDMINLNNQLNNIRNRQMLIMGELAKEEQNKIINEKMNEYFKDSEKANNEKGIMLFTNNGTNLDGNEETFKANLLKDVERLTGRKDLTIDDLIVNVNNPQLALNQELKDRTIKYSDYIYNKNKIDNRILDSNEINELSIQNFDKYALVGQNINDFQNVFKSNSNSFLNIAEDKNNKNLFHQLNSSRNLQIEDYNKRLEHLENIMTGNKQPNNANKVNNSNTQQSTNVNTKQQNNSNTQKSNNNQVNNDNNEQTIDEKLNNIIPIWNGNNVEDNFENIDDNTNRIKQIQKQVDDKKIKSNKLNSPEKIQEIYELTKDPNFKEEDLLVHMISYTGANKEINDIDMPSYEKDYFTKVSSSYSPNLVTKQQVINKMRKATDYFLYDLSSYSQTNDMLTLDLGDYNYRDLSDPAKQIYDTIKGLQDIRSNELPKGIEKIEKIIKDDSLNEDNNMVNLNENFKTYQKEGIEILKIDEELEKAIKVKVTENGTKVNKNGVYQENNGWLWGEESRDIYNSGKHTTFQISNNILKNLYSRNNDSSRLDAYFLATSDSVIKERAKYIRLDKNNKHSLQNIMRNPKERKEAIRKLSMAIKKARKNIEYDDSQLVNLVSDEELAKRILFIDSVIIPNMNHLTNNPAKLGRTAEEIYNIINPNSLANEFNKNN